jgi:hypothetical protein
MSADSMSVSGARLPEGVRGQNHASATSRTAIRDTMMESRKLRVGQPITPDEFDELSDEQLARLVPRAYREFFPGKDFCADGSFYLHDGTAWSFYKAGFVDD